MLIKLCEIEKDHLTLGLTFLRHISIAVGDFYVLGVDWQETI